MQFFALRDKVTHEDGAQLNGQFGSHPSPLRFASAVAHLFDVFGISLSLYVYV